MPAAFVRTALVFLWACLAHCRAPSSEGHLGLPTHPAETYRGDVHHRADFSRVERILAGHRHAWTYSPVNMGIHTASKSSPSIDESGVYVGSDTGLFFRIDRVSGERSWVFESKPSDFGIHGTAAIDDRRVYIGAYDGYVYALDKDDGEVDWAVKIGDSVGASPVLFDNALYIAAETGSPDGYLVALSRRTGKLLFQSEPFGDQSHSTPSIDSDAGVVFLGSNSGTFGAYDLGTGKTLWKFDTQGPIKSTAAVGDELVLFTSWDSHVYALRKGSGAFKWKFQTGMRTMSSPGLDLAGKRVVVGSNDGFLYALDLSDGRELWRFETGGAIISSPILVGIQDDGASLAAIVGSKDRSVYVVDVDKGGLLDRIEMDGPVTSVPVVRDGQLYVSSDGGDLAAYALGPPY